MKFITLCMLFAATEAINVEEGYNLYWEVSDRNKPHIWSVVKRGSVRDFADANVQAAMKTNPSSGTWPIDPAPDHIFRPEVEKKPHYTKQPWEYIVKKGNSAFNDIQVDKALKKIPEPIVLDGKAIAPGNPPMDHSW